MEDRLDLSRLNVELAKLAVERAEKREPEIAAIEENSRAIVKEQDEVVTLPETKEEFKVELGKLKAIAAEKSQGFERVAETYASKMADCLDKDLTPEGKLAAEGQALLSSLDRDIAKRQYVKAQRTVNDFMTDFNAK